MAVPPSPSPHAAAAGSRSPSTQHTNPPDANGEHAGPLQTTVGSPVTMTAQAQVAVVVMAAALGVALTSMRRAFADSRTGIRSHRTPFS